MRTYIRLAKSELTLISSNTTKPSNIFAIQKTSFHLFHPLFSHTNVYTRFDPIVLEFWEKSVSLFVL